jgi:hypothetical protein
MQPRNNETALTTTSYRRALVPVPARQETALALADAGWGQLPLISVIVAAGLLVLALANSAAPTGAAWAGSAFWLGLLLVFAPPAVRLFSADVPRRECIGLVVLVGAALYGAKVLHSPIGFTFSDELQHWRTAHDIVQTSRLFRENPLLPVSSFFPGLESAATALAALSGLSLYTAGVIIVGAGRLVGTLALFLLYERAVGSARVAGVASLLYAANPSYLFFGAQFAYESLAVPLSALVLYAAARRGGERTAMRLPLTGIALLALAAVVVTHHLTSYALACFLCLWALVALVVPFPPADHRPRAMEGGRVASRPWLVEAPNGSSQSRSAGRGSRTTSLALALLALAGSLTWLLFVATLTIAYLVPPISGAFVSTFQLLLGEGGARELFRSGAGEVAPLWEQVLGYLHVMLILAGLPLGLLRVWHLLRGRPLALALALAAAAYPATLAMRLTERGAEVSNRASAFLFVAVAFVLATWFAGREPRGRGARRWAAVFGTWASVLFLGGAIIGWPGWARLPGPYLAAADTRSVERQGLAAAAWARDTLGPDNRLIADRTNRLLMGTFGEQRPVTNYRDQVKVANIFFAPSLGPAEIRLLERGAVRYVVVDRRLSAVLPAAAIYIERGEPNAGRHQEPIDPAALAKFDGVAAVSRVFDSGDIIIYDVGRLSGEQ